LRATRANRDFYTDEKRILIEITVMVRSKDGLGVLLSKIVDCADVLFIRAQSMIRADGFSSAQHRNRATTGARIESLRMDKQILREVYPRRGTQDDSVV